jgi:hypothetical protein
MGDMLRQVKAMEDASQGVVEYLNRMLEAGRVLKPSNT